MKIFLNGREVEVLEGITLSKLIDDNSLNISRIVIELNEAVVDKSEVKDIQLVANDKVELLQFVGGG